MAITAKATTDDIAACVNCGARNYRATNGIAKDSKFEPTDQKLFDVRITNWVVTLCPACLTELSQAVYPHRS